MAYIYEHWRPDTNQCFYVGKGTGNRAYLFGVSRNEHHRRIVEKLRRNGMRVEVRIVMRDLSDEEALKCEKEIIARYGIDNLVNKTIGGDGLRNPTSDTRKKMSEARQRILADPSFRARHAEGVRRANERDPFRAKRAAQKLIGTKRSQQAIAKTSAALKGRCRPELSERMKGSGNPFFGKKHPAETLARIAIKKRGSKMSDATREKMRNAQRARRTAEAISKSPPAPKMPRIRMPFRHSPEAIAIIRIAAKKRGISAVTRAANIAALTGRKRAPFTSTTISKMRIAATVREQIRRQRSFANVFPLWMEWGV